MKKEVLLSLLMTTPVAFPALAITIDTTPNVDKGGWQSSIPSGDLTIRPTEQGNGVYCPVGVASLKRTYSAYPVGKYTLTLNVYKLPENVVVKPSNNAELPEGADRWATNDEIAKLAAAQNTKITVNGKELSTVRVEVKGANGWEWKEFLGFEMTSKGNIEIVISPKDATKPYSFESIEINLAVERNLENIKAALDDAFKSVKNVTIETIKNATITGSDPVQTAVNDSELAKTLAGAVKTLGDERTAITNAIAKYSSDNNADKLEAWKAHNDNLNTDKAISARIAALTTNVSKHNSDVTAENKRFQAYTDNKTTYEDLVAKQGVLLINVTNLIEKLEAENPNPSEGVAQNIKDAKALKTNLENFLKTINTAYADLNNQTIKNSDYVNAYNELETEYGRINELGGTVSSDWNAYQDFQNANLLTTYNGLEAIRNECQLKLANYTEKVTGAFAEQFTTAGDEIRAIIAELDTYVVVKNNKLCLRTHVGASEQFKNSGKTKAEYVKELVNSAGQRMRNVADDFIQAVGAQNAAYDEAMKYINSKDELENFGKGVQVTFNKSIEDVVVPSNFEKEFEAEKNKVTDKIAELKALIVAAYGNTVTENNILFAGSTTPALPSFQDKLLAKANEVKAAQSGENYDGEGGLDKWLDTMESIITVYGSYNELNDKVVAADAGRGFLTEIFKKNLDDIKDAIDAIDNVNDPKLDEKIAAINTKIQAIDENAGNFVVLFDNVNVQKLYDKAASVIADTKIIDSTTLDKSKYTKSLTDKKLKYGSTEKKVTEWATAIEAEVRDIIDAHQTDAVNATKNKLEELGKKNYVTGVTDAILYVLNGASDNATFKAAGIVRDFINNAIEANKKAAENTLDAYNAKKTKFETFNATYGINLPSYSQTGSAGTNAKGALDKIIDGQVDNVPSVDDAKAMSIQISQNVGSDTYDKLDSEALASKLEAAEALHNAFKDFIDEDVDDLYASLDKAFDNMDAYEALKAELDKVWVKANGTTAAKGAIATAEALNVTINKGSDDEIYGDAYDTFAAKLGTADDKALKKEWSDLTTKIKNTAENEDYTKGAAANEDALKTEVASLLTKVNNVKTSIQANFDKWSAQTAAANRAQVELAGLLDLLDKENLTPDGLGTFNPFAEKYNEFAKQLDTLNKNIAKAFGEGKSAENESYQTEAVNIENAIKAYNTEIVEGDLYAQAVRTQNEELMTLWNWTGDNGAFTKLQNAYKEANQQAMIFQSFENAGWSHYLNNVYKVTGSDTPGFGDVREIYKFKDLISALDAEMLALKNNANNNKKIIEKADFDNLVTKADNYRVNGYNDASGNTQRGIETVLKTLNDNVHAAAEAYYDLKLNGDATVTPNVQGAEAINTANRKALTDAKVIDQKDPKDSNGNYIITAGRSNLAVGENAVAKAKELYASSKFKSKDFDAIANELDKVKLFSDAELERIASDYWTAYYNHFNSTMKTMADNMPTYTYDEYLNKGYTEDGVEKNSHQKQFNNAQTLFNQANTTTSSAESVLSAVTTGKTNLKNAYNAAKDVHDIAKAAHDAVVADNAAYNAYMVQVEGLQTRYDALEAFSKSLAALNNAYSNVTTVFEGNGGIKPLVNTRPYTDATKTALSTKFDEFEAAMPVGYYNVAKAESVALNKQYNKIYAALSEASIVELPNYAEIEANVKAFEPKLTALASSIEEAYSIGDREEAIKAIVALKTTMLQYEDELSGYEIALRSAWMEEGTTPLTKVLTELQQQYDGIDALIDQYNATYNACHANVKAAYPDGYTKKLEELAAVKTSWEAVGDKAIMQKHNFVESMDAIKTAVDKLNDEIVAMQEPITKHIGFYNKANGILNGYQAIVDNVTTQRDECEYYKALGEDIEIDGVKVNSYVYKYNAYLNVQQELIDTAKKQLDEANKVLEKGDTDNYFKSDFIFDNNGDLLIYFTNIDLPKLFAEDDFNGAKRVVGEKLNEARETLKNPNLIPEEKDALAQKVTELSAKVDALGAMDMPSQAADGKTLVETINAEKDKIGAVITEIQSYLDEAAEHIFLTGDINCDNTVDINDVQMLIEVVGEGTQDQLNATQTAAADTNKDKVIDITDVARVIYIAKTFGMPENTPAPKAPSRAVEGSNFVAASFVSEEGGVRRYAVNITNSVAFVAGQLDIKLDQDVTLVNVVAADRAENHSVALFHHDSDNKRVILTNMDNAVIDGENGAVIYVDVLGEGNVSIENAVFTDSSFNGYRLAKPEGTSGIEDTVIDNNGGLKQRIYNAAGQALRGLQRGVNIIRNADGTVSKEYHK